MKKVVISSIGKDQPGIVGAFTEILFQNNCNIEDSSMTILCNQFTMILIVDVPASTDLQTLKEKFQPAKEKFKLTITINELAESDFNSSSPVESKPYMVSVSGLDKTGIASHICNILADYKVNITDFSSKIIAKDKRPVYIMMIETQIPLTVNIDELRSEIKACAKQMNLDFSLREIECCDL